MGAVGRMGLGVMLVLAGSGFASAAPPEVGSQYRFADPVFRGTIVCDSAEQVAAIARAAEPDRAYAAYYMTANAIGEPICMAIAPTGLVRAVTALGVMTKNGRDYDAWSIETEISGTVVHALYLERRAAVWA